jgi:hypothetical protein
MKIDFSPDKSLFQLPIVRVCAWFFGGLALLCAVVIAINLRDLPFDFSGDGFNKFAVYYKVPAAFIAIGFTLIGLCGANHRSGQSKAQMELASKQNIFANHFKHVEEFEKYCKGRHDNVLASFEAELESNKKHGLPVEAAALSAHLVPTHYRAMYKKMFPRSKDGIFVISPQYLKAIDDFAVAVVQIFREFSIERPNWECLIYELDLLVMTYADSNHVELPAVSRVRVECSGSVRKVPRSVELLFAFAQDAVYVQLHALSFDVDYAPSGTVRKFSEFDVGRIPEINVGDYSGLPLDKLDLPDI